MVDRHGGDEPCCRRGEEQPHRPQRPGKDLGDHEGHQQGDRGGDDHREHVLEEDHPEGAQIERHRPHHKAHGDARHEERALCLRYSMRAHRTHCSGQERDPWRTVAPGAPGATAGTPTTFPRSQDDGSGPGIHVMPKYLLMPSSMSWMPIVAPDPAGSARPRA